MTAYCFVIPCLTRDPGKLVDEFEGGENSLNIKIDLTFLSVKWFR